MLHGSCSVVNSCEFVYVFFNHDIAIYCLTCCLLLCTVLPVVAQNNIPYKCGNGIREPGETCDCGPEEVGYYGNF